MEEKDNSKYVNSGITFLGALGIAFIVLKLCGVIDWSWWWVLAPIWGPLAVWMAIVIVGLVLLGFAAVIDFMRHRREA